MPTTGALARVLLLDSSLCEQFSLFVVGCLNLIFERLKNFLLIGKTLGIGNVHALLGTAETRAVPCLSVSDLL